MVRLGAEQAKAKAALANAPTMQARSKLLKTANGSSVQVDENFDRAWRRIGLALDRVGFTVEDRDRVRGLYFVRYVDQSADANKDKDDRGFFSRMFSTKDKDKQAVRYQIVVKGNGDVSTIIIQNHDGKQEISATADNILGLLNDQLK